MKTAFEIIGSLIVSLLFISIPVLCTLSFVYNWFPGVKFILIVASIVEYFGLVNLLLDMADKLDK